MQLERLFTQMNSAENQNTGEEIELLSLAIENISRI